MYDPSTARFLSKDPLEEAGGSPNLYLYCANDPVNKTDPSGNRVLVPRKGQARTDALAVLRDDLYHAFGWAGKIGSVALDTDPVFDTCEQTCDLDKVCLFKIPGPVWARAFYRYSQLPGEKGKPKEFGANFNIAERLALFLERAVSTHDYFLGLGTGNDRLRRVPMGDEFQVAHDPVTGWRTPNYFHDPNAQQLLWRACQPAIDPKNNACPGDGTPASDSLSRPAGEDFFEKLGNADMLAKIALLKLIQDKGANADQIVSALETICGTDDKLKGELVEIMVLNEYLITTPQSCSVLLGLKWFCYGKGGGGGELRGCPNFIPELLKQTGLKDLASVFENRANLSVGTLLKGLGFSWDALLESAAAPLGELLTGSKASAAVSIVTALSGGPDAKEPTLDGIDLTAWVSAFLANPKTYFDLDGVDPDQLEQAVRNWADDVSNNFDVIVKEQLTGLVTKIAVGLIERFLPGVGLIRTVWRAAAVVAKIARNSDAYREAGEAFKRVIQLLLRDKCLEAANALYEALQKHAFKILDLVFQLVTGKSLETAVEEFRTAITKKIAALLEKLFRVVQKPVVAALDKAAMGRNSLDGAKMLTRPVPLTKQPRRYAWLGDKNNAVNVYLSKSAGVPLSPEDKHVAPVLPFGKKIREALTASAGQTKAGKPKALAGAVKPTREAQAKLRDLDSCAVKGQCFVGATPVRWEGENGFELKALEDVGLGDGVQTFDAGERVGERGARRLFAASMDRAVWLRQERGDGGWTEVGLIRSRIWLDKHGAARVGSRVELKLPEMGASGSFEVVAVDPCPPIRARHGCVVTGVFRHGTGRVFDLWVEGERAPLGVTAGHPIWSADRRAWVPAGALLAGERVQGVSGPVRVLRTEARGDEPVLTLEIDGDHCFRVGEQGILVHNASLSQQAETGKMVLENKGYCVNQTLDHIDMKGLKRFDSPFTTPDLTVIYILLSAAGKTVLKAGSAGSQDPYGRWQKYKEAYTDCDTFSIIAWCVDYPHKPKDKITQELESAVRTAFCPKFSDCKWDNSEAAGQPEGRRLGRLGSGVPFETGSSGIWDDCFTWISGTAAPKSKRPRDDAQWKAFVNLWKTTKMMSGKADTGVDENVGDLLGVARRSILNWRDEYARQQGKPWDEIIK